MNEDIQNLVNRVVQDQQEDSRKKKIESFINATCANLDLDVRTILTVRYACADPEIKKEMEVWTELNKHDFAYKLCEVARILLRQELLGEK